MLRTFFPNFHRGVATNNEREILKSKGITNRAQQDLLAWRRSALWTAFGALCISGAINLLAHSAEWNAGFLYSDLGHKIRIILPLVATFLAIVTTALGGLAWTGLLRWRGVMLCGAAIYLSAPFLLSMFPASIMLKSDTQMAELDYALTIGASLLIPVYSLLAGLFRGARIVKEASPQTSSAGLVVVLLVPINLAAIGCFGLMTVHMTTGWGLPIACIGAVVAQLPYIIRASTVISPLARDEYDRQMIPVRWIRLLGILMMSVGIVWALIATSVEGRPLLGPDEQHPWISWANFLRIISHLLANYLILLAVFCDFVDLAAVRSTRTIAPPSNVN